MPVAMEHALERVADKRGLKGKERDAFIYGAMRNAGWKPKQELDKSHKTNLSDMDKITYLHKISAGLDHCFDDMDDDEKRRHGLLGPAALVGAGVGGTLGHQAIQRAGGYGAAYQAAKGGIQNAAQLGKGIGKASGSIWSTILQKIRGAIPKFSSREIEIKFEDRTNKPRILQRVFLGSPLTIGIHGRPGEKLRGAGESYWNSTKKTFGGLGIGTAGGSTAGAAIGATLAAGKGFGGRFGKFIKTGAAVGGIAGANIGALAGSIRGNVGKKATEIYNRRTQLSSRLDDLIEFKIEIKKENKGKFTATKKKSGKTTEELKHSKNALTRKRATFAENAKKWKH